MTQSGFEDFSQDNERSLEDPNSKQISWAATPKIEDKQVASHSPTQRTDKEHTTIHDVEGIARERQRFKSSDEGLAITPGAVAVPGIGNMSNSNNNALSIAPAGVEGRGDERLGLATSENEEPRIITGNENSEHHIPDSDGDSLDQPGAFHIEGNGMLRNENNHHIPGSEDDSLERPGAVHDGETSTPPSSEVFVVEAKLVEEGTVATEDRLRIEQETRDAVLNEAVIGEAISENGNNSKKCLIIGVAVVVLVVGTIVGIILGTRKSVVVENIPIPTTISLQPTRSPSASPTLSELEYLIQLLSPISGRDALLDESSSQNRALHWLGFEDPNDHRSTNPSVLEDRYILALLYFCTQGDSWEDPLDFLTNSSVCEWPPAREDDSEYVKGVRCNNQGEVVRIRLGASTT
jgi:hypothetical protein